MEEDKIKKLDKFMLAKDCFLVQGAKRGALYDLKSGKVYSIDEDACQLLALCEEGTILKNILIKPHFRGRKDEILSYLQKVTAANLGKFLRRDQVIQKITLKKSPHKLDFVWLELTNRCNLRCIHCYNNSEVSLPQEQMCFDDWLRIIEEAYKLGCKKLQFIGGEPFLLGDNLIRLADHAIKIGYEFVEVFTNGTCISTKHLDFIIKNKIAIALSVYGAKPLIHDKITTKKVVFTKLLLP